MTPRGFVVVCTCVAVLMFGLILAAHFGLHLPTGPQPCQQEVVR